MINGCANGERVGRGGERRGSSVSDQRSSFDHGRVSGGGTGNGLSRWRLDGSLGRVEVVAATERLVVHAWREVDREPFAALNADPEVMRYFPSTLTVEESNAMVDRLAERHRRDRLCFWAVSLRDGPFIGMVGIQSVDYLTPAVPPSVEIGWRLGRSFWGKGYAKEAAQACLAHGFRDHGLNEIVAFTAVSNERSRRVMQRLGMKRDPDADFQHPRIRLGDPLRSHVLYRIARTSPVVR